MTLDATGLEVRLVDLAGCRGALLAVEAGRPRLPRDHGMSPGSDRHLSHIALRICLARVTGSAVDGVPFVVAPGGRPELPSRAASFSLSHTRGLALIAVAHRGPLGVDVERPRAVAMSAAHRFAILRAGAAVARGSVPLADDEAGFLSAWTRLEALAKADGSGMARLLSTLGARNAREVLDEAAVSARASAALARIGVTVHDIGPARCDPLAYAAVAAPLGSPPPVLPFPARFDDVAALAGM